MTKESLASMPISCTLKELKILVELVWDLTNDRFTLKMFGIPFERLQEIERPPIQEESSHQRLIRK